MADKKVKLLILYELLRTNTDENNRLDTYKILSMLEEKGIKCDRKILGDDIKKLNKYGFEIMQERHQRNEYYVAERSFDDAELRILMDAVNSANFISQKKTTSLLERIAVLSGDKKGELLKRIINSPDMNKTTNEKVLYIVDTIINAIAAKKIIKFKYFDLKPNGEKEYKKDGAYYTMLPQNLTIVDNKYYLQVYNFKHQSNTNFRVDRMDDVRISDDKYNENEVKKVKKTKAKVFGMYNGDAHNVTIIYDKSIAGQVVDRFGDIEYKTFDENSYVSTISVCLAPTFYAWCFTFQDKLTIQAPKLARDQYKEQISKALNKLNEVKG